eukprot:6196568-Pleurochrysis_carterae.AAC.1
MLSCMKAEPKGQLHYTQTLQINADKLRRERLAKGRELHVLTLTMARRKATKMDINQHRNYNTIMRCVGNNLRSGQSFTQISMVRPSARKTANGATLTCV